MQKLKIDRGFKAKIAGRPDQSIIQLPPPPTLAVSGLDIPHIRPKLLIKKGHQVKTGSPIFTDKRDTSIAYLSPATGEIKDIIFGKRRKLWEVVIERGEKQEFVKFPPVSPEQLESMAREDLVHHLKQGGLWQCFRQFPAKDTADPSHTPTMIILAMEGNDLFSPRPGAVLKNREKELDLGIDLLKKFSDRIVVTARKSSLKELSPVAHAVTHWVEDQYPAWDPGVVLYHLKQGVEDNTAWCISLQHLLWITELLNTGKYPTRVMVTATKKNARKPHIITHIGAPVEHIAGKLDPGSLITTGQFNGRIARRGSHLGFFETTLNVLPPGKDDEMFGFMRPGLDTPSVSNTFLSRLLKEPMEVDNTLHGEERACINCSYCQKICPNDLMPSFILKALLADDIEEALSMGLLDCCRCGLCSYACPSKIQLTQLLSQGMDAHHKDTF